MLYRSTTKSDGIARPTVYHRDTTQNFHVYTTEVRNILWLMDEPYRSQTLEPGVLKQMWDEEMTPAQAVDAIYQLGLPEAMQQ